MGLGLEELRGDGWQRMHHPDDPKRVLKAWHEAVTNGTPFEQKERHRGADGTYRWFLARGVPLRNSAGRIVGWHGTNTDIEDRKQTEEELRRLSVQLLRLQDESTKKDREGPALLYWPRPCRIFSGGSVIPARFLTCCTRRCWMKLV